MKNILLMVSLMLFIGYLILERQAGYCGSGPLKPNLPYKIKTNWVNGAFWLEDKDGWAILSPGSKLSSSEYGGIELTRILRYFYDENNLYIMFDSLNKGEFYAVVDHPNPTISTMKVFKELDFLQKESDRFYGWVDTDPFSCFWGRWGLLRIIILILILSIVFIVFRKRS